MSENSLNLITCDTELKYFIFIVMHPLKYTYISIEVFFNCDFVNVCTWTFQNLRIISDLQSNDLFPPLVLIHLLINALIKYQYTACLCVDLSTVQCNSNVRQLVTGLNDPHQSHKPSSHSDERRHRDDDQRQLPALYKSHEETTGEGGEALNEYSHLIRYSVIDFIYITVDRLYRIIREPHHTDAYVSVGTCFILLRHACV